MTHVRHGRTARDAKNLARHLLRQDGNDRVEVVAIVGLVAADLPGALAAMRRLAPRRAAAAFHHLSLSPSRTCATEDLRADADRMLREMGVDPVAHPHVLVVHGKTSPAGRAACHAHLVVAHWNLDGVALDDAWLHLRLERMAREIEHDRGDPLTPGRHDRALAKALRIRGRPEVAEALEAVAPGRASHSATTPRARQRLRRVGVDDVAARVAVRDAWAAMTCPADLRVALAEAGLSVTPGGTPGVWIVTADGGAVVGALDRIVKERRAVVAARMKETDDDRTDPALVPAAPKSGNSDADPGHRPAHGPAPAAPRPLGGAGGAEPLGSSARDTGGDPGGTAGGGRPPLPDRGGVAPASPIPAPGRSTRSRRVREGAAARLLVRGLNPVTIHEEAARSYLARRLAEVEAIYDQGSQDREAAWAPISEPAKLAEARARAADAQAVEREAQAAAEAACARRDALALLMPSGWRRAWWRIRGRLRLHQEALAKATATARNATDMARAHAQVATGRAFAVGVEEEKEARRRSVEVQRRRHAEAEATLMMERATIAADLLRADPTRGALAIPDLMHQAEQEHRRRQATEALDAVGSPRSGPR